jgi:polysaccharide pyruvyl transferase WcaK-like protein
LPLGYTHGDDIAMNRLNKKYGLSCYTFTHKLSIDEMTAILAGCNLYVGTSFHGSVVSISFGNMAISYNYYAPMLKNVDNYKRLGVSQYLAENYKELNPVLDRLLKKKNYKTNITAIKKQAEHHFDNLYKHIIGQTKPLSYENQMLESLLDTISNASLEIEKSKAESEDMLKKYKELNTTYESIISSRSYKLLQKIAKIKSTLKK